MNLKETYRKVYYAAKELYDEQEAAGISALVLNDLGYSRIDLVSRAEQELSQSETARIKHIIGKLSKAVPVQYALGYTWFLDLKIELNTHVLIPRRETEELADIIIKEQKDSGLAILDIGTGSGCIALSLARYLPSPLVHASDSSADALDCASKNASRLKLPVNFIHDDILHPEDRRYAAAYDLIVSNPPYVLESEKTEMHRNVLEYEPSPALFVSDSDPLVFYREIEGFARKHLKKKGSLYLEINEKLGRESLRLFEGPVYKEAILLKDMQGKDRFIKVSRK